MSQNVPKIPPPNCPILEAVLDIDSEFGEGYSLAAVEVAATKAFTELYPVRERGVIQEHQFLANSNEPSPPLILNLQPVLEAIRFKKRDKRQVVQVRRTGFSFNRLAPYSSLDDYLPEIQRTWLQYLEFAKPRAITEIRLRNINKINLPASEVPIALNKYFHQPPPLPDDRFAFSGFFQKLELVDSETGFEAIVVLAADSADEQVAPIILDVIVRAPGYIDPADWEKVAQRIASLRQLKNFIFDRTVTQECLSL